MPMLTRRILQTLTFIVIRENTRLKRKNRTVSVAMNYSYLALSNIDWLYDSHIHFLASNASFRGVAKISTVLSASRWLKDYRVWVILIRNLIWNCFMSCIILRHVHHDRHFCIQDHPHHTWDKLELLALRCLLDNTLNPGNAYICR